MKNLLKFILILDLLLLAWPCGSIAQEIDFGQYGNYSMTLSELGPDDLDFGILVQNEGLKSIPIANAKVLTLEGVKYLDVIVDITADNELLLNGNPACSGDPSCSIPLTIDAAYANRGENNIAQARFFSISGNTGTTQFRILRRGSGPPGPPPTPEHKGFNPSLYEETAYIYLFGSVNVGNVSSGSYSGQVTVSVVYD